VTINAQRKTLFDRGERTDAGPMRHDESAFGFLNRTADPRFAQGRLFFEGVFARYPEEHRAQLRGRFRSKRDEQHQGAILELMLFAALEGQGVEVSDRTPDFRVGSGDERWCLEATSLTPDKFDMPRGLRTVVATIQRELRSSDYFLHLRLHGSLKSTPRKERYLKPLRELLETPLDKAHLGSVCIRFDGMQLTATLMPKGSPRGDSHSVIGIQSYGDAEIVVTPKATSALLKTLVGKARKIGERHRCARAWLAVAIPDDELAIGFDDLMLHALFGADHYGSVASSGESFWFRRDRSPVRTHIEGVVVLGPLLWWALESSEMFCRVYRSPWTERRPPTPLSLLPTVGITKTGAIMRSEGKQFAGLLGDQVRRRTESPG